MTAVCTTYICIAPEGFGLGPNLSLIHISDGVQQERAVLTQAAGYVVHVQVSLNVTSNEVRSVNQISGTDRRCV